MYRHVLAWKGNVFQRQRRQHFLRRTKSFSYNAEIVGRGRDKEGNEIWLFKPNSSEFDELEEASSRLASMALAAPDPQHHETRRQQIQTLTKY